MKDKLTMLMILDGFGDNPNKDGNAIKLAKTPNMCNFELFFLQFSMAAINSGFEKKSPSSIDFVILVNSW